MEVRLLNKLAMYNVCLQLYFQESQWSGGETTCLVPRGPEFDKWLLQSVG